MLDLFYLAIGVVGFAGPLGDHQGLRPRARSTHMFDYIVSGIVSVFLLVYLGWAMFRPEKF